jgi:hypothetical protein
MRRTLFAKFRPHGFASPSRDFGQVARIVPFESNVVLDKRPVHLLILELHDLQLRPPHLSLQLLNLFSELPVFLYQAFHIVKPSPVVLAQELKFLPELVEMLLVTLLKNILGDYRLKPVWVKGSSILGRQQGF